MYHRQAQRTNCPANKTRFDDLKTSERDPTGQRATGEAETIWTNSATTQEGRRDGESWTTGGYGKGREGKGKGGEEGEEGRGGVEERGGKREEGKEEK